MVMLFLTALDQQATHHQFCCGLSSLEANFDFLSSCVARGNTLLTAYVIEEGNRTQLPLAAFDGLPLSTGIQALQQEWQHILSRPRSTDSLHHQELLALTQQRLDQWTGAVADGEVMVGFMQYSLEQAQQFVSEPRRSRLISGYQRQLARHQAKLEKARFHSRLMSDRLRQLEQLPI